MKSAGANIKALFGNGLENRVLELECRGYARRYIMDNLDLGRYECQVMANSVKRKYFSPESRICAAIALGMDITPADGAWSDNLSYIDIEMMLLAGKGFDRQQIARLRSINPATITVAFDRVYNMLGLLNEPRIYDRKNLTIALLMDADRKGKLDWGKGFGKEQIRKSNNGPATIMLWELMHCQRMNEDYISDADICGISERTGISRGMVTGVLESFVAIGATEKTGDLYATILNPKRMRENGTL